MSRSPHKGLKKVFSSSDRKRSLFRSIGSCFLSIFGCIFRFFANSSKKVASFFVFIYRKLASVPFLGTVVTIPERFCTAMFVTNVKSPLFLKEDDAMAFFAKLKGENVKHKVLSVFVLLFFMFIIVFKFSPMPTLFMKRPFVARIKLHGAIGMSSFGIDDRLPKVIDYLIKEKKVAAVIISVDSPGGGITPSELLYRNLLRLSDKKTTIASIKSLGASGGYLISLGCSKIFALETSVVGSIGVISKFTNVSGLQQKLGLKTKLYKSSPFKASPNMYEEITKEVDENEVMGIKKGLDWFKHLVKTRRNFSDAQLNLVANAKVFYGFEALKLGLIDGIGDETIILDQLVKDGVVQEGAKIIDINYMPNPSNATKAISSFVSRVIGVDIGTLLNNDESYAGEVMLQH